MPEQQQPSQTAEGSKKKLSPKLVRDVADKVYALWLKDLTVEKERRR